MNHFPDISKMVSGAAQILPNLPGQNRAKPASSGPICPLRQSGAFTLSLEIQGKEW
jgi:hypothetical protein